MAQIESIKEAVDIVVKEKKEITDKIEKLEEKCISLENNFEKSEANIQKTLVSAKSSPTESRLDEIEQRNFILLHAVDDVERAVRILQVEFRTLNPEAFTTTRHMAQPKGILSTPSPPKTYQRRKPKKQSQQQES